MQAIQLVMPSTGDMVLIHQEGGTVLLQPVFYGGECAGPHLQVVDVEMKNGKVVEGSMKVLHRFRLKIRSDGRVELKKGGTAEETQE